MDALLSPQILCTAAPVAAPVGHPSLAGDRAVPWLRARSGACGFCWFFINRALFSGGDGLCWHGARGSPLLARKPDAWSHCLALPGKAGKASAGVIKQHAGAAGPEPPASEVPPHFVTEHGQHPLHQTTAPQCWVLLLPGASSRMLGRALWMALEQGAAAGWKGSFPCPPPPPEPSTSSAMLWRERSLTVSRLQ